MIRCGSRSFYVASKLLPRALRNDAYALYGFCRLSDDLVDVSDGTMEAIVRLRARLDRVYAGAPAATPVDRAMADVVARHDLPRALPEALLEGFEWDVLGTAPETLSDLYAYAARVAGSVGVMMSVLMGVRSPQLFARACDLGVAMQLTNIARDVGEDARAGRLYLPRAWFAEAGVDPDAWLSQPRFTPAIRAMLVRLLDHAERLYRRADVGVRALPADCRVGIMAAQRLYREIGVEVAKRGYDSLSGRAKVSFARKLQLAAGCVGALRRSQDGSNGPVLNAPPLPETAFLVDAAAAARPSESGPAVGLTDRVVWVAELFARLEAQEKARRRSARGGLEPQAPA